jgi:hypothetical protein
MELNIMSEDQNQSETSAADEEIPSFAEERQSTHRGRK